MRYWRPLIAVLFALGIVCSSPPAASASGANEEPMWIFEPIPPQFPLFEPVLPPPVGYIYGPCGAAVDSGGYFYVSDYYHHAVDVWDGHVDYSYGENERAPSGGKGYVSSLLGEDPVDGPCGLALDAGNHLFINNYHRNVVRFGTKFEFGEGTIIAGQGVDSTHPTGLDIDPANEIVYVDSRTYVSAYYTNGAPVMDGGEPLHIGAGSLEDGYGVAYSRYPGTLGRLYVPDAASNTVKVYDPSTDKINPIEEIDGSETPNGEFVSLRNASIAIDRVSGEIYVVDNLQPRYTERPNAAIFVFEASGGYEGHLKYNAADALPVGLAIDNSAAPRDPAGTQGRVYVTSGNTEPAAIYGYHADAATTEPFLPGIFAGPLYALSVSMEGAGGGSVLSSLREEPCVDSCQESVRAGTHVTLTAKPDGSSSFVGWSGACSGGDPSCSLADEGDVAARARFAPVDGTEGHESQEALGGATSGSASGAIGAASPPAAGTRHRRHVRHRRRHHRRHGRHGSRRRQTRAG
jgi:DNA-binding beta-propeller fold protein YncE